MRLIIHPGFSKCGSSAIQHALQNRAAALKRRSIFLFGRDLALNDGLWTSAAPIWTSGKFLLDPSKRGEVPKRILREIERISGKVSSAAAVLSTEVLGRPDAARMFEGLDARVGMTVVFYIRPQFEWIPSAWKEFSLTKGVPLEKFTADCLAFGRPAFCRTLEAWTQVLPQAKIIARVLPATLGDSRGPAGDFFRILGADADLKDAGHARVNSSLDFSILHVLSKSPWVFADRSGLEVFRSLARLLPDEFLATNAKMLSLVDERRIADHFRDENMQILRNYVGLSEEAAEKSYAIHYCPTDSGRSYREVQRGRNPATFCRYSD